MTVKQFLSHWWSEHSRLGVAIFSLIAFVSTVPFFAGFLLEPPGMHFTGALTYSEDIIMHEAWASEMTAHLRWQNLLTPESIGRGWYFNPLELCVGIIQQATGIPYIVLRSGLGLLCAPALAIGLMTLARRAGLSRPGVAATIALLAGSFAPFEHPAVMLGLIRSTTAAQDILGDATPTFVGAFGAYFYLLLVVLVLVALPLGDAGDTSRGSRLAGVPLSVLAIVYPFFVPTLGLTAVLCALLWARSRGWRSVLKGIGWLGVWSGLPMIYWLVLPHIDAEYARFAAVNLQGLFSIRVVLVSLGLGVGAIIGIPRLLRGSNYQQMLACFSIAFCVALYVPAHPFRTHLFMLSPVLVITALAAWWSMFLRLRPFPRWILASTLVAAATISALVCYTRNLKSLVHIAPPAYITSGDVAAIDWFAKQQGAEVVLARWDLSPLVASRGHHRVVVGHWAWTHQYESRRAEVMKIFENGADPQSLLNLLKKEQVTWVLLDEDRGVPTWATGVKPVVRFDQTVVLRADQLLEQLNKERT
jgi:hypothetical protein